MSSRILMLTALMSLSTVSLAQPRDYITVVGSSTVWPFATKVAEQFARRTPHRAPKVESTGTGDGLVVFCAGLGVETPDIADASRPIHPDELALCRRNGVDEVVEVKIGFDGIVLARAAAAGEPLDLSRHDLYRALAARVPDPDGGETLVDNPYTTWDQVNPDLPSLPILVVGPPTSSGTREAFVEMILAPGCREVDWSGVAAALGDKALATVCHTLRGDGHYRDGGEDDGRIVQTLRDNPQAMGIFGFSYLDRNHRTLQGARLEGVAPTFETIATGDYPASRPLFLYIKKAHVGEIPGLADYLAEFTSEGTFGPEGYLVDEGLITLDDGEREAMRRRVRDMEPLALP